MTPTRHARETDRDPGPVPRRFLNTLEGELEHQLRFDMVHRAESLDRVAPDERVDLADLFVAQSGVRLGKRDELAVIPDAERVIGEQAGPPPIAGLGVNQDAIHRVRIDLPLPPIA